MRIISKFKDYYDSVQAYGQDEKLVYFRKTTEIEILDPNLLEIVKEYFDPLRGNFQGLNPPLRCLVGFCGKVYPMWRLNFKPSERDQEYSFEERTQGIEETAYTSQDIIHFLTKHKDLSMAAKIFLAESKDDVYPYVQGVTKRDVEEAITKLSRYTKLNRLFQEYKSPVFVIEHNWDENVRRYIHKLTLNPCLKDYGFFKQRDVFNTYQEISMYISGILGLNDPDIIHISDKDMKAQKGFYDYSFKTLPTKKR